jgi:hypothetical protein
VTLTQPQVDAAILMQRHHSGNFAFVPHVRERVEGDITYGDTSFSFDWLRRKVSTWEIVGYDHVLSDILQLVVFLRPTGSEP